MRHFQQYYNRHVLEFKNPLQGNRSMALNRVSFACGEEQVDRMARVALVTLEERKKRDAFNELLVTARAVYKSLQLCQTS